MSDLVERRGNRTTRLSLLATVSAIALMSFSLSAAPAQAAGTFLTDADHPAFWVELGGDFEKINGATQPWNPPVGGPFAGDATDIRTDPTGAFGLEGKLSYLLDDWKISVSARYGRAQRDKNFHTQATGKMAYSAVTRHTENHLIADFQIGKDVGLGLWGKQGHSEISAGIRIAQFNSESDEMVSSDPQPFLSGFKAEVLFQTAKIERRTSALGPSLSWDGSVPLAAQKNGSLAFDWGASGALLFGRQKFAAHDKSRYYYSNRPTEYIKRTSASDAARSKSVLIPNLKAFAGLSYNFAAAKIAVGYRADFYFNAVDGGIAAAHSVNRTLYGPFASISVGIGG